jgi:hypothetical protein
LCTEVVERLQFWEDNRYTLLWHKESCTCRDCTEAKDAHLAYRAAQGRHIIYSEMSYIVQNHRMASVFLNWLFERMTTTGTDYWWAVSAMSNTCAFWLLEWQKECLPRALWAVSGFVWFDQPSRKQSHARSQYRYR